MPSTTAATRAIPREGGGYLPPPTREEPLPPRRPERAQSQRKKSGRGKGLGRLIVALAVILAVIAVILIATNGGGTNKGPVNSNSVHGQINGLKQLIQDNEK
jgi:hypothetical protein